jgi:hypothetical protein
MSKRYRDIAQRCQTYIELAEHVTRRKCHLSQIRRIPSRQDDAAILRIVLDLVNALRQLVHALPSVVGVHVHVFRAKVTPLEPVHGAKIAFYSIRKAE